MAAVVPPVAGWRYTGVPNAIPASDVQRLLDSCYRGDPIGIRDYAILMLAARLGLRSAEVARLELGDIDWRAGQITLRSKACRQDGMPLPCDVGEALAYLSQARPATPQRRVLLTARGADAGGPAQARSAMSPTGPATVPGCLASALTGCRIRWRRSCRRRHRCHRALARPCRHPLHQRLPALPIWPTPSSGEPSISPPHATRGAHRIGIDRSPRPPSRVGGQPDPGPPPRTGALPSSPRRCPRQPGLAAAGSYPASGPRHARLSSTSCAGRCGPSAGSILARLYQHETRTQQFQQLSAFSPARPTPILVAAAASDLLSSQTHDREATAPHETLTYTVLSSRSKPKWAAAVPGRSPRPATVTGRPYGLSTGPAGAVLNETRVTAATLRHACL